MGNMRAPLGAANLDIKKLPSSFQPGASAPPTFMGGAPSAAGGQVRMRQAGAFFGGALGKPGAVGKTLLGT